MFPKEKEIYGVAYIHILSHSLIFSYFLSLFQKKTWLPLFRKVQSTIVTMFRLFIKSRYKNFSRELTLNLLISPGNKTKQAVTFSRSRKKIISRSINIDTESND